MVCRWYLSSPNWQEKCHLYTTYKTANWIIIYHRSHLFKGTRRLHWIHSGYFHWIHSGYILFKFSEQPPARRRLWGSSSSCSVGFLCNRYVIAALGPPWKPMGKWSWVVVSNIFYFQPYLGKIPILSNIFQMGWNHQLGRFFFQVCLN